MSRRRIPENVRWLIIRMHGAGMSCRNIGVNLDISRLVRKHADTGHVKDRLRQGRPCKTTPRDDSLSLSGQTHPSDDGSVPEVALGSRGTSV